MKPGLELPIPRQRLESLRKVGQCIICHTAMFSWGGLTEASCCADFGEPAPWCEHPDELCSDPKCAEKRRVYYKGKRKLKHPCKFPRLRDQEVAK